MDATLVPGAGARRALLGSLLLPLALTFLVLPANAGKPGSPTPTATITDNGGCSFTVTYTWSGFSGTGLVAELAFGYKWTWGANVVFAWERVPNQNGSGGSVSATFTLTGTPTSHEYFGRGNLFKVAKNDSSLTAVRNASAASGYLGAQACGSTVTVS